MPLPIYSPPDYGEIGGHSPAPATAPVTSVNGATGDVTINAASLGLGAVNNTSDADKPVSTSQQAAIDAVASTAATTATANATTAVEASLGTSLAAVQGQWYLD